MPLSHKGLKMLASMRKHYGEKKGEQLFYATENKGKVTGLKRHKKK